MRRIPRRPLETERLMLEPTERRHADAVWAATEASLPDLRPWLAWTAQASRENTRRFTEFAEMEWASGREFDFVVTERASGDVVGTMGIRVPVELRRTGEIGYWVRSDRAGRGYGTEAARAVVEFGFERLDLHRIELGAGVDNRASQRIAEKLGFTREGVGREAGWNATGPYDLVWYGLLSTDPRPGRAG